MVLLRTRVHVSSLVKGIIGILFAVGVGGVGVGGGVRISVRIFVTVIVAIFVVSVLIIKIIVVIIIVQIIVPGLVLPWLAVIPSGIIGLGVGQVQDLRDQLCRRIVDLVLDILLQVDEGLQLHSYKGLEVLVHQVDLVVELWSQHSSEKDLGKDRKEFDSQVELLEYVAECVYNWL